MLVTVHTSYDDCAIQSGMDCVVVWSEAVIHIHTLPIHKAELPITEDQLCLVLIDRRKLEG